MGGCSGLADACVRLDGESSDQCLAEGVPSGAVCRNYPSSTTAGVLLLVRCRGAIDSDRVPRYACRRTVQSQCSRAVCPRRRESRSVASIGRA